MDPISNVDRLVLLLRERLLERSKANRSARRDTPGGELISAGTGSIQALAAEEVDDRQLKRALVQRILVEQMGSDLLNEAAFQHVIDKVTDALEADAAASRLFAALIQELRTAAG